MAIMVDPVQCADDPAQTYALYLPSRYVSRARGGGPVRVSSGGSRAPHGREVPGRRRAVRLHHRGIQQLRNGPHAVSAAAAQAMSTDVGRRFCDRSPTGVSGRHVGRRAGGDGHRPRQTTTSPG